MLERFLPADPLPPPIAPQWFNSLADWIRGHSRQVLAAGIIFQLLVLSSMIALHAAPLVFGERIWLRVVPVDPRDLFRGDYVVLSYDFSRPTAIDGVPIEHGWSWNNARDDKSLEDRTVYVALVPDPDGKHYVAGTISFSRPAAGRFLKGRYSHRPDGNDLHFGIEAFYVEEGRGKSLEQLRNARQLEAEIAVTPWGQATLCDVR